MATRAVSVTGATGESAAHVNGMYDPTEEVVDGATAYRKRGDPGRWLQYNAASKDWNFQPTANRGPSIAYAYVACDPLRLPDQCEGLVWKTYDGKVGGGHELCPLLTITVRECIAGPLILKMNVDIHVFRRSYLCV